MEAISEMITVKMFGGEAKKLNEIDIFRRFGLIAKTVVLTSKGGRTEDMKLYHMDFDELTQTSFVEEDGTVREYAKYEEVLLPWILFHNTDTGSNNRCHRGCGC